MMFLTAALCAGFQSCSDDDEEEEGGTTFSNFYIVCSNVSGGGWSSQECESLCSALNEQLVEITNKTQSEAIEFFNQVMKGLARDLSSYTVNEPLYITFELKVQSTGQCVKRATITVKKDGTTVS